MDEPEEGRATNGDLAGTEDPDPVCTITLQDLRFNLSKKNTVRSKRQVGIEELKRVIEELEAPPKNNRKLASPPKKKPKKEPRAAPAAPQNAIILQEQKETLIETPRLPWEKTNSSAAPAKSLIMNIETLPGVSKPPLAVLSSPTLTTTITYPEDHERRVAIPDKGRSLDMKSWSISLSPGKKLRKHKKLQIETTVNPPVSPLNLSTKNLRLEASISEEVQSTTPTHKARQNHEKASQIMIAPTGEQHSALIALTPKVGRLIQVKEYIITNVPDEQSLTSLPMLYTHDVIKALHPYDVFSTRNYNRMYKPAHINYDSSLHEHNFSPYKCTKTPPARDRHVSPMEFSSRRALQSKWPSGTNSRGSSKQLYREGAQRSESQSPYPKPTLKQL